MRVWNFHIFLLLIVGRIGNPRAIGNRPPLVPGTFQNLRRSGADRVNHAKSFAGTRTPAFHPRQPCEFTR